MMSGYRVVLPAAIAVGIGLLGAAQAATPSKQVQTHCVNDYKKYCSEWGLESKGLRNCMHKHGDRLNHACVNALVASGEVSKEEVERRKKAAAK